MNFPLGRNPYFVRQEAAEAERLKNPSLIEDLNTSKDKKTRFILLAWTCILSNFIVWYDDPQTPFWLMCLFGAAFVAFLGTQMKKNTDLIFYIFVVYVSFQKVLPGDFAGLLPMFNLTNILLGIIVWTWLFKPKKRGTGLYDFNAVDVFLMTYITFLTVAMLRSEFVTWQQFSIFYTLTDFKRMVEPFLVYFIFIRNVETRRQVIQILYSVCIVVGAVGVMGVKQYYMDIGGGSFSNMNKNQITILTDQPNQLGTYLGTYSFFLLSVFFYNRKKWYGWASLVMFLFCLQAVRVTFSRGGLLAFCAGLGIMLILLLRWKIIFIIPLVIVLIISYPQKVLGPRLYRNYIAYINQSQNLLPESTDSVAPSSSLDASAASRLTIMRAGWIRVTDEPLSMFFGVGMGKFSLEMTKVRDPHVGFVDAHNQWLLILVENGIIALISFWAVLLILVSKALYIYFKTKDKLFKVFAAGFVGGITAMYFGNFVGSRMNSNEVILLFWILSACLMRLRSIELGKTNNQPVAVEQQK